MTPSQDRTGLAASGLKFGPEEGVFIGGRWVPSDQPLRVHFPYDGREIAVLSCATEHHVDLALAAARKASAEYRRWSAHRRADFLKAIARRLADRLADLATAVTLETGKPITEARIEAQRSVRIFEYAAGEAQRLCGEMIPLDALPGGENRLAFTLREPVGIVAAITPFNFPLALASHKVAPALAAGNAVVLKPAAQTPLSAVLLGRAVAEAGGPEGVFNLLAGPGSPIGQRLVSDSRVGMVTFTGSVDVGRAIRREAGLKRVTLELGANCAAIVEPDADLQLAATRCTWAAFAHSGQVCISLQRLFVHRDVFEELTRALVQKARDLVVGHPFDEATQISCLITRREAERVEEWIHRAVRGGARVLAGGQRRDSTVVPTILTDVRPDMEVCCREVFGPVVTVTPYDCLDEAIGLVNDSRYGLQAGVFTQDISRALAAASQIETGGVMINEAPMFRMDHMPYGGVKESGLGREGPHYAIEEMTERKIVTINLAGRAGGGRAQCP